MALQTSYQKSDNTLQQSVLCQYFPPTESLKMPLNVSEEYLGSFQICLVVSSYRLAERAEFRRPTPMFFYALPHVRTM